MILLTLLALGLAPVTVKAAERQQLAGHIPRSARGLAVFGRLNPTNRLQLSISLPLRNTNELEQLLRDIYDPASPTFHHYLSAEEFAQRFGPTQEDYAAVTEFCRTNGLTITSLHPNRTIVGLSARASAVENAFHTRLNLYHHPRENRVFYAPESEPAVDLATPILHIQGLDTMNPPRAHSKRVPIDQVTRPKPNAGSGSGGLYQGNDFRRAFAPGVTLTGTNQTLALLEFDGYYPQDITAYLKAASLAAVPLHNVLVSGFNGQPGSGNGEVSLDIQVAIAMAPGLKQIIVYEAGMSASQDDILNRIATDNSAKQISSSWSWGTQSASTDQIFVQLAVQGQAFFEASGDGDAWGSRRRSGCARR